MLPCVFHIVFKSVNESTVPWTRAQVDNLVGGYCKDSCSILVPCKSSLLDHKLHEYSTLQNNGKWFSKEGELIYILLIITEHLFIAGWPSLCLFWKKNVYSCSLFTFQLGCFWFVCFQCWVIWVIYMFRILILYWVCHFQISSPIQ